MLANPGSYHVYSMFHHSGILFKGSRNDRRNYSGILYGRMQQTVKDLDESLKEIYYVDTRAAWDEASGNVRSYISTKNEDNLETVAELLRNHSREYKDINSLYFVFPGEKMAVTSEEFPVNKQGLAKKIFRSWKKSRLTIPSLLLWNH